MAIGIKGVKGLFGAKNGAFVKAGGKVDDLKTLRSNIIEGAAQDEEDVAELGNHLSKTLQRWNKTGEIDNNIIAYYNSGIFRGTEFEKLIGSKINPDTAADFERLRGPKINSDTGTATVSNRGLEDMHPRTSPRTIANSKINGNDPDGMAIKRSIARHNFKIENERRKAKNLPLLKKNPGTGKENWEYPESNPSSKINDKDALAQETGREESERIESNMREIQSQKEKARREEIARQQAEEAERKSKEVQFEHFKEENPTLADEMANGREKARTEREALQTQQQTEEVIQRQHNTFLKNQRNTILNRRQSQKESDAINLSNPSSIPTPSSTPEGQGGLNLKSDQRGTQDGMGGSDHDGFDPIIRALKKKGYGYAELGKDIENLRNTRQAYLQNKDLQEANAFFGTNAKDMKEFAEMSKAHIQGKIDGGPSIMNHLTGYKVPSTAAGLAIAGSVASGIAGGDNGQRTNAQLYSSPF